MSINRFNGRKDQARESRARALRSRRCARRQLGLVIASSRCVSGVQRQDGDASLLERVQRRDGDSVMNGVVIPAFEAQNPGIKVNDEHVPVRGDAQQVHRLLGRGRPTGLDAFGHCVGAAAGLRGNAARNVEAAWFAATSRRKLTRVRLSTNLYKGNYYGHSRRHQHPGVVLEQGGLCGGESAPPTTFAQMIADARR